METAIMRVLITIVVAPKFSYSLFQHDLRGTFKKTCDRDPVYVTSDARFHANAFILTRSLKFRILSLS